MTFKRSSVDLAASACCYNSLTYLTFV